MMFLRTPPFRSSSRSPSGLMWTIPQRPLPLVVQLIRKSHESLCPKLHSLLLHKDFIRNIVNCLMTSRSTVSTILLINSWSSKPVRKENEVGPVQLGSLNLLFRSLTSPLITHSRRRLVYYLGIHFDVPFEIWGPVPLPLPKFLRHNEQHFHHFMPRSSQFPERNFTTAHLVISFRSTGYLDELLSWLDLQFSQASELQSSYFTWEE